MRGMENTVHTCWLPHRLSSHRASTTVEGGASTPTNVGAMVVVVIVGGTMEMNHLCTCEVCSSALNHGASPSHLDFSSILDSCSKHQFCPPDSTTLVGLTRIVLEERRIDPPDLGPAIASSFKCLQVTSNTDLAEVAAAARAATTALHLQTDAAISLPPRAGVAKPNASFMPPLGLSPSSDVSCGVRNRSSVLKERPPNVC